MSSATSQVTRVYELGECPPDKFASRKAVAIGDLHGDFYRLVRILEEEGILIKGTLAWSPQAINVDLILIGDYVDWRGEPLEGEDAGADGSRRIIELIFELHKQTQVLRDTYEDFDGRLHALRGNHDDMMLDALRVFDFMTTEDVEDMVGSIHQYMVLRKKLADLGLEPHQTEIVMKFLNWYVQGGKNTLEGWDSVAEWREAMEGPLGSFLRHDLQLGVVVNRKLYSHSAPDPTEFWRPRPELLALPSEEQARVREAFLWSRKLWGFDFYSGGRSAPFTQDELEAMLAGFGVDAVVVGHTPVTTKLEPFIAYEGKVINIDLHGIPNSQAYIDSYAIATSEVRGWPAPAESADSAATAEEAEAADATPPADSAEAT